MFMKHEYFPAARPSTLHGALIPHNHPEVSILLYPVLQKTKTAVTQPGFELLVWLQRLHPSIPVRR